MQGTIMVTGAGGYIGNVLVRHLLAAGYRVKAADRFFFGTDLLADIQSNPALKILRKDVRDLDEKDLQEVTEICDLAALSNDPAGDLNEELTYAINFHARARLSKMAKEAGVKRYIFASSASVYGAAYDEQEMTEEDPVNPLTTYAKCNVLAEESILSLASETFTPVALRNATVFGLSKRMRFDLLVNLMTLNAINHGEIFVQGGGQQNRPLIHVKDIAEGFLRVLKAPANKISGEIFNLGHENRKVISVAYLVRQSLPFKIDINIQKSDPDRRNYRLNVNKMEKILGYRPATTIIFGIEEIAAAITDGVVRDETRWRTVEWYKYLLKAERDVAAVLLDGRLLS